VQELLVQLLNEHHEECKRVAISPLGRGLPLFLGQHPDFGQDEGVLGMAGTMNDLATKDVEELAAETDAPESSKRVRKQPERYNGLQYDNDGAYIDDLLLVNQATEEFFGYQDIGADEDAYNEEAARRRRREEEEDDEEEGASEEEQDDEDTGSEEEEDDEYEDDGTDEDFSDVEENSGEAAKRYKEYLETLRGQETKEVSASEEADMLIAMVKHANDGPCTVGDLKDARKLRLGLLLLYQARIGQKNLIESTSIHTNYESTTSSQLWTPLNRNSENRWG
jgi:hypothetical protein